MCVGRQSKGQLPCGDVRAVSHISVVQDLRDIAGNRSFKHGNICSRRLSPVAIPQSAGSAASVLEPAPGPRQARTRPAPGPPHQARTRVFSPVKSQDLTGNKKRATVVVPRDNWKFFSLQSLHGTTGNIFPYSRPPTGQLEIFFLDLGWRKRGRVEASMPGRWRGREAPMPGRFAETVGLDDSFEFFSWEESRPWRGLGRRLLCRAGGAVGRLCQAAPSRRTLTVHQVLAIRAICAIWVSQGKPLNIHSPPAPCYMCHMCNMV